MPATRTLARNSARPRRLLTLLVAAVTALILAGVGTLAGAGPAAAGSYPGHDGKLAFVRANQIYTINAGGSGLRRLTINGKNYAPKWSPDGTRLAYVHEAPAGVRNVWLMNGDGTGASPVTTSGRISGGLTWSPDGIWIVYSDLSRGGGDLLKIHSAVPHGSPVAIKAKAAPSDPLTPWPGSDPSWSANGRYLAFISDDYPDSPDHYFLGLNLATGMLTVIGEVGGACCGEGYYDHPSWSPDGTNLAYESSIYGLSGPAKPPKITVFTYSSGNPVAFSSKPGDVQPDFSPSGRSMALVNVTGGTAKIYIATASGTSRRLLTTGYTPDWQPTH